MEYFVFLMWAAWYVAAALLGHISISQRCWETTRKSLGLERVVSGTFLRWTQRQKLSLPGRLQFPLRPHWAGIPAADGAPPEARAAPSSRSDPRNELYKIYNYVSWISEEVLTRSHRWREMVDDQIWALTEPWRYKRQLSFMLSLSQIHSLLQDDLKLSTS